MKIQFENDYKGERLETRIGNEAFLFERKNAPFEVTPEVGAYCLRLGYFNEAPVETPATSTAPLPKEIAPRKG